MSWALLMVWDGLHIVGEVFGLTGQRADRFADTLWLALVTGLLGWATAMLAVAR